MLAILLNLEFGIDLIGSEDMSNCQPALDNHKERYTWAVKVWLQVIASSPMPLTGVILAAIGWSHARGSFKYPKFTSQCREHYKRLVICCDIEYRLFCFFVSCCGAHDRFLWIADIERSPCYENMALAGTVIFFVVR